MPDTPHDLLTQITAQDTDEAVVVADVVDNDYLCIRQGQRVYGILASQIREVVSPSDITLVPHSPSHILGVVSLRGRALPIFDMARYLGEESVAAPRRVVIAAAGKLAAGIPVEEVVGLRNYSQEQLQPPLPAMHETGDFCYAHVLDEELIVWIIDAGGLLASAQSVSTGR